MGTTASTAARQGPDDADPTEPLGAANLPDEFTDDMTHYQVLGLRDDASDEDIKRAYRRSALRHHPDKNPNDLETSRKRFERAQIAYETLSDPAMKHSYDVSLSMRASSNAGGDATANRDNVDVPGAWTWTTPRSHSAPQTWTEWAFGRGEPKRSRLFSFQEYVNSVGTGEIVGVKPEDVIQWLKGLDNIDQAHEDMYTVFETFFRCLAYDEAQWGGRSLPTRFGTSESVWDRSDSDVPDSRIGGGVHEVKDFYYQWLRFKTSKSFEWIVRYVASGELNPRLERLLRNKNKPLQIAAQKGYNELIQSITFWVMHHDPRFIMHMRYEALKDFLAEQQPREFHEPGASGGGSRKPKKKKRNKHNSTIH